MPSPFPGMDPFLENPGLWPGVHAKLIATLWEMIGPLLPGRYWVDVEERIYVEIEEGPARPLRADLAVTTERRGLLPTASPASDIAPGFVAVEEELEVPIRERFLVIRQLPGRELVTVVEVLSPANKTQSGRGAAEYRRKRKEVLSGGASLVEVDLLRGGARPAPVRSVGPHDYVAVVHRCWEHPRAWGRGWGLQDGIPDLPIPLLPADPCLFVPLQQAVRFVYDRGAYERLLDYSRAPDPPLSLEQHRWAVETLHLPLKAAE